MTADLSKNIVELLTAIKSNIEYHTEYHNVGENGSLVGVVPVNLIADEIEEIERTFKRYGYIAQQYDEVVAYLDNIE